MSAKAKLLEVLTETRGLLSLRTNDFIWSSWEDAEAALEEINDFIYKIDNDLKFDRLTLRALYAATGSIGEVALSSGWADEYLKVASKFDTAIA